MTSYEPPPQEDGVSTKIPRIDDETIERLRDIGRRLRPSKQVEIAAISSQHLQPPAPPIQRAAENSDDYKTRRTGTGWGVSFLLLIGVVTFAAGIGLMIWSATVGDTAHWFGALVATLAGEGALIVGLAWMAVRLWRNSRRVNRQLVGVEDRLADVQLAAGQMASARMTSSQTYYQHFGAGMSPSLAMANLRGQLEELSTRVVERGA